MTKNPLLNALAAGLYITLIASGMYYSSQHDIPQSATVIVPIAMLSLFTLSAAVMGYVFLFQPIQLFLSGDKKKGANLFLHTLAAFACLTAIVLILLYLSSRQ